MDPGMILLILSFAMMERWDGMFFQEWNRFSDLSIYFFLRWSLWLEFWIKLEAFFFNKSFQEIGELSLEKPIAEAIKCYLTLDSKLFEAYMEQKIEPIGNNKRVPIINFSKLLFILYARWRFTIY